MRRRYKVRPGKSLRENLKQILPEIYDDFFSYRKDVTTHPRRKDLLHQMRISGKPMRYIMEIAENTFGEDFRKCLDEYKDTIEILGDIHDADVVIPELVINLKEIRFYNRTLSSRKEHITTKAMREMIKEYRTTRNNKFIEFRDRMKKWEEEDFRGRLIRSMETESTEDKLIN